MIVVKNILFTHINVSTVHKHIRFIDICSCFFYIEGSSFCVVTFLGSIKCSYSSKASLYFTLCRTHLYAQTDIFLNMYVTYYTLKTLYKTSNTFFYNLNTFFHFLTYGYRIKFKVIGLGHRAYYTKSLFLLKLGYSHLVYSILNIQVRSRKKKIKKQVFFKLWSINNVCLLNTFFYLQNMRIPDVYNLNGIFNLTDGLKIKQNKKASSL